MGGAWTPQGVLWSFAGWATGGWMPCISIFVQRDSYSFIEHIAFQTQDTTRKLLACLNAVYSVETMMKAC